jgi:hypothetical protein
MAAGHRYQDGRRHIRKTKLANEWLGPRGHRVCVLFSDASRHAYSQQAHALSPNEVAGFVLGKCTWAVLTLACDIELFSLAHYRASIAAADDLSPLFKDVFLFHWKEESQHATIDELEWIREDAKLATNAERDAAVEDLIALVGGVDGILQQQALADTTYFLQVVGMPTDDKRAAQVGVTVLKAYRWQYIVSGTMEPRFQKMLASLVDAAQMQRIQAALAPLAYAVPDRPEVVAAMAH